ncbi:MAG: 2-oxo acid dehydrogenase subunit E2 [Thermaceae bacterium]
MEVRLPDLGDNVASATVVGVLVKEGDLLEKETPVLELETDKAVMELPAGVEGRVLKVHVRVGDEVRPGQVILEVEEAKGAPSEPPKPAAQEVPFKPEVRSGPPPAGGLIPAAPSVRRLARELGVDLSRVVGTGLAGRITAEDVRKAAGLLPGGPPPPSPVAEKPALPDFSKWGPIRREAMSSVRKATLRAMERAWSQIPMVTHFDQADVTELEEVRKKYASKAEAQGVRLTMTAFVLKAVALTLKAFPKFNASLDPEAGEILYKDYIHLGVAVDTPHGLLVPVVREVDRKGVFALARELADLSARARERKLALEEMQGASFSVSNLGGIGGRGFTPIVNWPEVAILGVSRSEVQPVWDGEAFRPRLVLPFSLTYDHRLIDGAEAARFCRYLAGLLEDPMLLALEG